MKGGFRTPESSKWEPCSEQCTPFSFHWSPPGLLPVPRWARGFGQGWSPKGLFLRKWWLHVAILALMTIAQVVSDPGSWFFWPDYPPSSGSSSLNCLNTEGIFMYEKVNVCNHVEWRPKFMFPWWVCRLFSMFTDVENTSLMKWVVTCWSMWVITESLQAETQQSTSCRGFSYFKQEVVLVSLKGSLQLCDCRPKISVADWLFDRQTD